MKYDIIWVILCIFHFIFFINLILLPSQTLNIHNIDIQQDNRFESSFGDVLDIITTGKDIKFDNRYAYITFTKDDGYIKGIVALYKSLLNIGTKHNLVVMVTDEVSGESIETLKGLGCIVKVVDLIPIPSGTELEIERWRSAFTKFRSWEMIEYERVIWLDSDMLVFKNIDHLFEYINPVESPEIIYAAVDADANSCQYKPSRLSLINSGILVLTPSLGIYNSLVGNISVASQILDKVNDQDVINITLPNWLPLNYPDYGAQVPHCLCEDKRLWNFDNIYFIHFTAGLKALPKPWDYNPHSKHQVLPPCAHKLYSSWMKVFQENKDPDHLFG